MERIKRRRLDGRTWRGVLERFDSSGLTVQAFCRGESISTSTFYRWRARPGSAAVSGRAPLPAVRRGDAAVGFVDLGPLTPRGASTSRLDLKLDLGGGLVLHLVRS